jgi:hypothetical protein
MDNHKQVTISIFVLLKHDKNAILFLIKYAWKFFSCMHTNKKTYFCIFFLIMNFEFLFCINNENMIF